MIVPDTIEGSILLSAIDFILSIVMISGIGFILALFPLLNRLGKVDETKLKQGHH